MKNTQNLKLSKPDGSDLVKVSDLNTNWDMLDGVIGSPQTLETVNKNSLIGALNEVNAKVEAGIGGGDGNYVLPKASSTVLGGIKIGQGVSVNVNGVLSTNSNVPWVNDMVAKIGLLESLTTTAKDSLVSAINEINGKTGGGAGNVTWDSLTGKPSQFPSSPSLAGLGNVQNFGIASEYDATQGTSNAVYMTPLRVANKIKGELAWKEVKANENLDHYKTEGNYYCPLNVTADTITNAPFGGTAFSMIVLKNAGCTQIATTFNAGLEEIKVRNEYQGGWGTWKSIITERNITTTWAGGSWVNGSAIPNVSAVDTYCKGNFLRDSKASLPTADLNNANFPYPYVSSTSAAQSIALPFSGWCHVMYFRHQHNNGFGAQIAIPFQANTPTLYVRNSNGNTWSTWRDVSRGGLKKVHKISGSIATSNGQRTTITIPTINAASSFVGNTTGCIYPKGSLAVTILNNTQVELRGIFSDSYGRDETYSFEIIEFN